MSERNRTEGSNADQKEAQGPNLVFLYSLIVVALLIAIAVAAFIVWPFYQAR